MRQVESFRGTGPMLYICSTPIGNLDDVSERLLQTLRTADVVAAEDTRHTRKLLTRYDIHVPELWSYNEHNAKERESALLTAWGEGKSVALCSDAGTPIVSDPGDTAVRLAIENGVPVVPIPGPSALLAALVASGLPAMPFTFVGFLPRSGKELRQALSDYGSLPWTYVFYEAPHRIEKTLRELALLFPERMIAIGKELTKRHETFLYGTAFELSNEVAEQGARGEYVVVVGPPGKDEAKGSAVRSRFGETAPEESPEERFEKAKLQVMEAMQNGMRHKEAVQTAAKANDVSRKELYNSTLE